MKKLHHGEHYTVTHRTAVHCDHTKNHMKDKRIRGFAIMRYINSLGLLLTLALTLT